MEIGMNALYSTENLELHLNCVFNWSHFKVNLFALSSNFVGYQKTIRYLGTFR